MLQRHRTTDHQACPRGAAVAAILSAAIALSGCSIPNDDPDAAQRSTGPQPVSAPRALTGEAALRYEPPRTPAAAPVSVAASAAPSELWTTAMNALTDSGLEITHANPDDGTLIAIYRGDPEPFVDCGKINVVAPEEGGTRRTTAATERKIIALDTAQGATFIYRAMRLDGRLAVRLEPTPGGTAVESSAQYVLSRLSHVRRPSGEVERGEREQISFRSGSAGQFPDGTTCVPTGRMEALVLERAEAT